MPYNNPAMGGMEEAMMGGAPAGPSPEMGQPAQGGVDPGEVLEQLLMAAEQFPELMEPLQRLAGAIGPERFEQLMQGGEWSETELDALVVAAQEVEQLMSSQGAPQGGPPGGGAPPGGGMPPGGGAPPGGGMPPGM